MLRLALDAPSKLIDVRGPPAGGALTVVLNTTYAEADVTTPRGVVTLTVNTPLVDLS